MADAVAQKSRPSILLMAGAVLSVGAVLAIRPWEPLPAPPMMVHGHLFGSQPPWKRVVQTGVPENYAAALADLDSTLAGLGDKGDGRLPSEASLLNRIASLRIQRAQLTGSLEDMTGAQTAIDAAFAHAGSNAFGPHWERIAFNFYVHRLGALEPDLKALEAAAVGPNLLDRAGIAGWRADVLFYTGHYDEAFAAYRQLEREQSLYDNLLRLSTWYWRTGDFEKAGQYLNEAEWLISGPALQQRGWFELQRGLIAFDQGKWDEASKHFAFAHEKFPGHFPIEGKLAKMQALNGDLPGALKRYIALADSSGHPDMMDAVAGVYRAMGDRANSEAWAAKAGAQWERRLAAIPEAAWGHAIDHYLTFGNPARALELARLNAAQRPFGEPLTQLAAAQLASGQPDAALKTIQPVLASKWKSAQSYLVAADAWSMLGRKDDADAARKQALAINPRATDRNAALALIH